MATILLSATVAVNISRYVEVDSIDDVREAVKEFERDSYFAIRLDRNAGDIEAEVDEGADSDGISIFDEGNDQFYDNIDEYVVDIHDDSDHELHGTVDSEANDYDDNDDAPIDTVNTPTSEAANDVDAADEPPIDAIANATETAPKTIVRAPKITPRRNHKPFAAKVKSVFNRIARHF